MLAEALNLSTRSSVGSIRAKFIKTFLPTLLETPVLRQLCHLQRTLDPLDIEGLYKLYKLHLSGREEEPLNLANINDEEELQAGNLDRIPFEDFYPEPTLEEWVAFVEEFKSRGDETLMTKELDPSRLHYFTLSYLLGATFKDCSIILRPPSSAEEKFGKVTIIDLDVKSIRRLKKWSEQDRRIVEGYEVDGDGGICVDACADLDEERQDS